MPYGSDPAYEYYQQTGAIPVGNVSAGGSPGSPVQRSVIVDFWKNKGAPDYVAEGIADATHDESGIKGDPNLFNPTAVNPKSGAVGLQQDLGDRKKNLQAKPNWQDPKVQLDNAYSEVTGGDAEASKHWDEIKTAKTREQARDLFKHFVERPGAAGGDKLAGGYGKDAAISAPGWNVSNDALLAAQKIPDSETFAAPPQEASDGLPSIEDTPTQTVKRKSLMKSLDAGHNIEEVPKLDGTFKDGIFTVKDFDGRTRLQAAQQAGVDLVPISLRGVPAGAEIKQIKWPNGKIEPFNWKPWGKVESPPPSQTPLAKIGRAAEKAVTDTGRAFGSVAAGAAEVPVGVAQLAAHGAEAVGIPGAPAVAGATDTAANALSNYIGAGDLSQRGAGVIGNAVGTAFLPGTGGVANAGALRALAECRESWSDLRRGSAGCGTAAWGLLASEDGADGRRRGDRRSLASWWRLAECRGECAWPHRDAGRLDASGRSAVWRGCAASDARIAEPSRAAYWQGDGDDRDWT